MTDKLLQSLRDKYKNGEKIRILFVCLGNICRSPAAQGIMQSVIDAHGDTDRFFLDSAGLYGGHAGDLPDKRMRVHAIRRGYSLTHRSRKIHECDFDDFDLVIGMDDANIDGLRRLAPTLEDEAKIVRMTDFLRRLPYYDSVPDPYYEGAEGFEHVLDLLEDATESLFDQIAR
ncbi:MAG: low molecular weight phosphotyrosine protein phosphatase [Muribaculaceae bacterium]|nr:low molecular weight phosphotyrosine protein phosphatase [Muribaculaceae bacterium]